MRIACLADTHLTVPEIESDSLFRLQLNAISRQEAETLYEKMRREVSLASSTAVRWLEKQGPWDAVVHLGDVTGGYREQGCSHPSCRKIAREIDADLQRVAPRVHYCLGNHETGYSHRGSLAGGGINVDSIEASRAIFGELFWSYQQQEILLVGLCSPIAEYRGSESAILRLQQDQRDFLRETLALHRGPWLLFAHNPFTMKNFVKEIKGRTDQLLGMVCGDVHNPRYQKILSLGAKIVRTFLPDVSSWKVTLECLGKCIACPSVAPLWWKGYQLLTLSFEKGRMESQRVVLDRPPESENLPVSSVWRCLLWTLRPRM